MTFERILYVALSTDPDACIALNFLSKAQRAETQVVEDGEDVRTDVPVIPIFTYHGNGECRFPSKFLRAIRTNKRNPHARDIPVSFYNLTLSMTSRIVLAIKPLQQLDRDGRSTKMKVALENFHREQTGENLSAGNKTHHVRKSTKPSIYKSDGLFGTYDY